MFICQIQNSGFGVRAKTKRFKNNEIDAEMWESSTLKKLGFKHILTERADKVLNAFP